MAVINNLILEFEGGNEFHREYFNLGEIYYGRVSSSGVSVKMDGFQCRLPSYGSVARGLA